MSKTKLVLLGSIALALIVLGAFFSWLITSNHFETKLANQTTKYTEQLKSLSDASFFKLQNEVEKNNVLIKKMADSDYTHYQEYQNAQKENEQLKSAIANGTKRVQFAEAGLATCKLTRSTTSTSSSLGDGTSIELSGTAGQNILDIRDGIAKDQAKLKYFQSLYK